MEGRFDGILLGVFNFVLVTEGRSDTIEDAVNGSKNVDDAF